MKLTMEHLEVGAAFEYTNNLVGPCTITIMNMDGTLDYAYRSKDASHIVFRQHYSWFLEVMNKNYTWALR